MIDVVSVKFKNKGKSYYFAPNGFDIKDGDTVIVETSKGLEIANCARGIHAVEDTAVIQPLRPVVRIATEDDKRVAEINKYREKEAFEICQKKIAEHGLEMKLVDVECSFEGNKITFFFTADGRVDFRELVKDLAGIFRNRIELRQIGVRDEAKMIGGLGICGRPYCCHQFMDDFEPVSTKMAKVQSLSLNPAKISGSCGRLMCCLRYEEEAYEELVKKVPKQGAFVETIDGYGTAVQVNLLRQQVKVRLDTDTDDTLHVYKANELAAVPGGRPKEGEPLPKVLNYVPEPEETEEPETSADSWEPAVAVPDVEPAVKPAAEVKPVQQERPRTNDRRPNRDRKPGQRGTEDGRVVEVKAVPKNSRKQRQGTSEERKEPNGQVKKEKQVRSETPEPHSESTAPAAVGEPAEKTEGQGQNRNRNRRYYYHGRPRNKGGAGGSGAPKAE